MAFWLLTGVVISLLAAHAVTFRVLGLLSAFLAALLLGAVSVITIRIIASPKSRIHVKLPSGVELCQNGFKSEHGSTFGAKKPTPSAPNSYSHIIVNRSVSSALQNLLDLIFRDILDPQLRDLVLPEADGTSLLKRDLWDSMYKLSTRLSQMDGVQFFTQDVVGRVTLHMEKIRCSQPSQDGRDKVVPYCIKSYLLNAQSELQFLRKVSEVTAMLLFPKPYIDYIPMRHLIREVLACQAIDALCDPDTVNQQIVVHLRSRQALRRDYVYTQSYEDFVTLIEECDDLNEVQQIRMNIVTEIAQATAISSVKRSKGMEIEQEFLPQGNKKGDLLQARNLKRYIKELTYAKLQCDRRLRSMGVPVSEINRSNAADKTVIEEMVPSFKTVMRNGRLRHQLGEYLEQQGDSQLALLKFWLAVQEMRRANRAAALQIASKIFFSFLYGPNPQLKFEKGVTKSMEGFLSGDKGPEAFYQAQDNVWKILEERHYPSFLVVLTCKMTGRNNQSEADEGATEIDGSWNGAGTGGGGESSEEVAEWAEQTLMAKSRLESLESKLNLKLQSLSNLRKFAPLDCPLMTSLEKEIEALQSEKMELENWQNQADTWASHLGHWKAIVILPQNADDKDCVRFAVEVHLDEDNGHAKNAKRSLTSWTIGRQVAEFYALHSKLSQQCSWLKSAQLPALSGKTIFGKVNERVYLEKAQEKLQLFLDVVMSDDLLNKSEALFTFLHNTPVSLRPSVNAPKKSRFFLATLFKSDAPRDSDDDAEVETVAGPTSVDETDGGLINLGDDTRDGIAEPIYHLLGEVFELRGVFGWLRRTLVTFVQITYGRTINRQLRESISSLFSDQAVLSYVQMMVKTWWPDGSFSPPAQPRNDEEKRKTRQEAHDLLLSNIPDVLCQLLGQQNARRGILKVFNTLQDQRLNKQLFYDIAEVVIKDLFPEVATPRY